MSEERLKAVRFQLGDRDSFKSGLTRLSIRRSWPSLGQTSAFNLSLPAEAARATGKGERLETGVTCPTSGVLLILRIAVANDIYFIFWSFIVIIFLD